MKTKKCSRCGVEKPLNEFYPRLLSKKEEVMASLVLFYLVAKEEYRIRSTSISKKCPQTLIK